MDVLQIIKADHDSVRNLLFILETADAKHRVDLIERLRSELSLHTKIEESYLYPEVADLTAERLPGFFDFCIANHRTIVRSLELVRKAAASSDEDAFSKSFQSLNKVVSSHFEAEEDQLMPLIRKSVSTPEREELGVVFEDLKGAPELLEQPSSAVSKKRTRA